MSCFVLPQQCIIVAYVMIISLSIINRIVDSYR